MKNSQLQTGSQNPFKTAHTYNQLLRVNNWDEHEMEREINKGVLD